MYDKAMWTLPQRNELRVINMNMNLKSVIQQAECLMLTVNKRSGFGCVFNND